MNFALIGCNHRSAPVDIREQVAFEGEKLSCALDQLSDAFPEVEFVLLSTCNRVELYSASPELNQTTHPDELTQFIARYHSLEAGILRPHLYRFADRSAIRHLFSVASSLDSLVPGEGQILGQVKEAYDFALRRGVTGPLTNALFQKAFAVGKKIHSSTLIAQKKVSVSSVAVEFACEIFQADQFPSKTILVIGAGKMGELTLEHLRELRPGRILVANRNEEKAAKLARKCAGEAVDFTSLEHWMAESDLILSTTGSTQPLVDKATFAGVMLERGNRPVFVVDIAVPRDFDQEIGDLENVYLYNIDDLERQRDENLKARNVEVQKGEAIVELETETFLNELTYKAHSAPIITQLRREWDVVRESELERLFGQYPDISDQQRKAIAHGFERFQNQLLHLPLSTLRSESEPDSPPHGLLDALKRLFHLS